MDGFREAGELHGNDRGVEPVVDNPGGLRQPRVVRRLAQVPEIGGGQRAGAVAVVPQAHVLGMRSAMSGSSLSA